MKLVKLHPLIAFSLAYAGRDVLCRWPGHGWEVGDWMIFSAAHAAPTDTWGKEVSGWGYFKPRSQPLRLVLPDGSESPPMGEPLGVLIVQQISSTPPDSWWARHARPGLALDWITVRVLPIDGPYAEEHRAAMDRLNKMTPDERSDLLRRSGIVTG